jgi:hypothetical protein
MMSMKLSKLPDRTPVKLSTTLPPHLAARLRDYADFYAETYGSREEVADLVPFMLEAFLDGDTEFRRASRTAVPKEPLGADPLRNETGRRAHDGSDPHR